MTLTKRALFNDSHILAMRQRRLHLKKKNVRFESEPYDIPQISPFQRLSYTSHTSTDAHVDKKKNGI